MKSSSLRSGAFVTWTALTFMVLLNCATAENIFHSLSHAFDSKSKSTGPAQPGSSGNSNGPDMSVSDPSRDQDSPQQATEPRGDDFPKMVAGAIASVVEYEAAKRSASSDTRPTSVFYDGLGWFYRNGTMSNLNKLPVSPAEVGTRFTLFTKQDQVKPDVLDYTDASTIQRSRFDPRVPSVIITHGFKTSKGAAGLQWVMLFVDALFRRQGPGNYIVVDWSNGAQAPDYWRAAANTPLVGAQIAALISLISKTKQVPINSFSLMGFSLGSHASGFAGKRLGLVGKPQRIFGIDAAGPLFEGAHPDGRLSKGDAMLVVAEHGSADGLKNGGLGIWQQLGDVDFYANGGREQPGCGNMLSETIKQLMHFNFKAVPDAMRCNHDRNWMYVLQSFDAQCQYMAAACDKFGNVQKSTCNIRQKDPDQAMGFFINNRPSSSPMFFDTVDGPVRSTACQRHIKISIKAAKQSIAGRGSFVVTLTDNKGTETTPYVIAQDGRIPSGKQAFLLVRSETMPSDIKKIKVTYHRLCDADACNADTINLDWVTLANVNNDVVMSYCDGGDLVSEQPKDMNLQPGLCRGKSGDSPLDALTSLFREIFG